MKGVQKDWIIQLTDQQKMVTSTYIRFLIISPLLRDNPIWFDYSKGSGFTLNNLSSEDRLTSSQAAEFFIHQGELVRPSKGPGEIL